MLQDEYEALKKKQDEDIPPMNVDNPVLNNPKGDQEMLQIDIIQNYNKNIGRIPKHSIFISKLLLNYVQYWLRHYTLVFQ